MTSTSADGDEAEVTKGDCLIELCVAADSPFTMLGPWASNRNEISAA